MSNLIEMTISDLYSFKQCPLRYKMLQVDKLTGEMSPNDGIRESIKSAISYYYYNKQDGKKIGMEEMKEKLGNIWFGEMDLYNIKFDGNVKKREAHLKALGMLNYFHRSEKYNTDEIVAVNLDFRIPFGDGFFVKGTIPLIRDTIRGHEIVNFKTGHNSYDEFWQRTDMEMTLQAMAYESMFKREVDSICVHNLNKASVTYIDRKRKDYKRLYKTIEMVKSSIDNGWFYPRESYSCDKCPVKKFCMEWN